MPQYQPYLIAPFKTGRYTSHDPWLAPSDAFPTLVNARINKGVLEKRPGITLLATTNAGLPVMGIWQYRYKGAARCLVFDTRRAYKLDLTTNALTDLAGSDKFTGTDRDYWRFAPYGDTGYFTNGQSADGAWKYDAKSDDLVKLDIAASLGAKQFTAKMAFNFPGKNRILLVGTIENGEYCPRRIRYSEVDSDVFPSANYIDGRFDDVPICGAVLGKEILIFCQQSIQRIRYTGDTKLPFTWEPVSGSQGYGSVTPFVCEGTQGGLLTLNDSHVVFTNGYEVTEWDTERVRGIRAEIDTANIYRCYGCTLTEDKNIYIAYPPKDSSYCTEILDYNAIDQTWATYKSGITFNVLGAFAGGQVVTTYPQIKHTLEAANAGDVKMSAMDLYRSSGAITLAGDRAGRIYQLNSGSSDNTAAIAMDVRTAHLNPFAQMGRSARLGWVDLLVSNDSTASATVAFHKDSRDTPYKTVALDCTGGGDKHWVRLPVGGESGRSHEMRISNNAVANRPRIHAMEWWFAPGARLAQ